LLPSRWDRMRSCRSGRGRLWFSGRQMLVGAVPARYRARAPGCRYGKVAMPVLKDRLAGAGYGLGWRVVCRLPESWARRAFRFSADLAWRRQGPRVRVLEGNLRRVIGSQAPGCQLRGLSRQVMRSYARYWLEVFRLPVIPADRLLGEMHVTGHIETAFAYLAAGRGVILALPHMGNYDLAGAWLIARGAGPVTVVAERLRPESVYDRFVAFREGLAWRCCRPAGGLAVRSPSWRSGCGQARLSAWCVTAMSPAGAWRWSSSARRPA
jgi:phosphatidylinositol dimannoside acyltransferase